MGTDDSVAVLVPRNYTSPASSSIARGNSFVDIHMRVLTNGVFLLGLGLPLVCVQVWYRRPPAPPSAEPVRIQFTTDRDACEADGWQRLGPDDGGEEEFRAPDFEFVSPTFRAEC